MLLSKLPALDKGYVALIDSCNTATKLREIDKEFFDSKTPGVLLDLGHMTIVMKCPLFVQLNLSKFSFKVINTYGSNTQVHEQCTYTPNPGEIGAREATICNGISADIAKTAAALLINPSAYQADGADHFISHINTPISIYTTILVHGSYDEWCKWCDQKRAPAPIAAYIDLVKQIKSAEWKL
jgi:hypothetical protein